jgi:hypothetical protein
MQYALLIYDDQLATRSDEERAAIYQEYMAFSQELHASGAMVGGDQLAPVDTATTVRVRDGQTLTTDGPFAETKELLGGYYLIDVESIDEALEWAAKIPSARFGSIEVRPIVPVRAEAQG